jgi:hypothetical protein
MSVTINEDNYKLIRNNDPLFQVMTRISDTNNVVDVVQEYVKIGSTRNDFATQLELFDRNVGILNDGKSIDMTNFFIQTKKVNINGVEQVAGKTIPYFKFKTNFVLDFKDKRNIAKTYIDKRNYESVFDLYAINENTNTIYEVLETKDNYYVDHDNDESTDPVFIDKFDDRNSVSFVKRLDKTIIESTYNSYPLQRVDKLTQYELDSLFVFIDGRKIPDNEVFIYTNNSFTDVFIPEAYIPGNIRDKDSNIDTTIHIDYRQPGSEALYFRETIEGNSIVIDLKDEKYGYEYNRMPKEITVDKILLFVNGYLRKAESLSIEDNVLTINCEELRNADVEVYIMNDLVYRYSIPTTSMLNSAGNKLHFYINDNYVTDVLSGPITKNAISFFYKGERILDEKITQTSRFSFEYQLDPFYYEIVLTNIENPIPGVDYYTKDSNNNYIKLGEVKSFERGTSYYRKTPTETFDESKFDFIIEDLGYKIDDLRFKTYGDDYYLLNMLGVKRCVDKMKGTLSYSVFDKPEYSISFRNTLSNNGSLFDVPTAMRKYTRIANTISTPKSKVQYLIQERPTLLRRLLEQFKIPSKKYAFLGNESDVKITSVSRLNSVNDQIYYKVYLNHILLNQNQYTVTREDDFDSILIDKSLLKPLVGNANTGYTSGINYVELFQYDLTYRNKTIFKENISNGFTELIDTDGETVYQKTYTFGENEFNFDPEIVTDDFCAIEKVCKSWFDSRDEEYYYFYPTSENIGYRLIKQFNVIEKTDTSVTVRVKLYKNSSDTTNGNFFIMSKQYNVVHSFLFDNSDGTYMEENDLLIPLYTKYDEEDKYIPYICNSEPLITHDGKEMIYGKDYVFTNPEKDKSLTCSYLILKKQTADNTNITINFNSSKTNILIVGYDDLNIDNMYGLVYLSELPYPVSTEYMNIFVNGEKLSSYDIDILSDKLIRVHNMNRPIRSILITTNSQYKNSELQDFIDLYEESDFEKLLANVFWNCDPSKNVSNSKPNVDYVYKVDPYYSEFIGSDYTEDNYDEHNPYYKDYINDIKANAYLYNGSTNFIDKYPKPSSDESDYELKLEAWENAKKFFDIYKTNHGFVEDVDSVKQAKNPYDLEAAENYISDTLEIMYLNWLANSGKTRTYGFKADNIDPIVLKYFSIYENIIIDNRIDIVIDSNKFYDGLRPDVTNQPYEINDDGTIKIIYPAMSYDIRRRYFFEILLQTLSSRDSDTEQYNPETGEDYLMQDMCNHKMSNILYPNDFPLEPDSNGIRYTGTEYDICNNDFTDKTDELLLAAIQRETAIRNQNI